MAESDGRICNPISTNELKRRWAAVRAAMPAAGFDALIVQGASNLAGTGGYFRWFTGISPSGSYPQTIIFPQAGLMTHVMHGPWHGETTLDGTDPMHVGVGRRLTSPAFPGINYCVGLDPEIVAREIKKSGFKTVGYVGANHMLFGFGDTLKQLLGTIALRDATDIVDPIKAVKSEEEIGLIRRTAAMQDEILAKTREHVRPGMRDFEVMAYSHYVGQLLGSETGYFLGTSAPPGQPAFIRPRNQQGRAMQKGDAFFWQAENTGPGGLFVHMGRMCVLGKPSQELVDAHGLAVEAQRFTVKMLKPGALCRDIYAEYQAWMRGRKLPEEARLHCHGQGYDVVERPLIRNDESMKLAANMNIGIHPSWANARMFMTVCDNFLIGADGTAERLHKTPQEIVEL
jgi:Xaa-Pro aminopeptidase